MIDINVEELKIRIEKNKDKVKDLKIQKVDLVEKYTLAGAPDGYKSNTSYNDYDAIHGSRKEYRIEDLAKRIDDINAEIKKLETWIKFDEKILNNILEDVNINEYLSVLKTNKDKVKFLKEVCGFTQQATADKLDITKDAVYKIEKRLRSGRS